MPSSADLDTDHRARAELKSNECTENDGTPVRMARSATTGHGGPRGPGAQKFVSLLPTTTHRRTCGVRTAQMVLSPDCSNYYYYYYREKASQG